ncbi:MAG: DNA alkylation repair protein [Anaerolineae bacterium]
MIWEQILEQLQLLANPEAVAGMARFGITPTQTYGVSLPQLRGLAKLVGQDHALALRLWETDIRETRILASMVADSRQVSEELMEQWVKDFDYWEICDQCCMNLFYSEADAWLDQYIVIEESGDITVYRN